MTVHGYGRDGMFTSLLLGGRNRRLAGVLGHELGSALPEYQIVTDLPAIPRELRGLHSVNPVNVPTGGGVPLELPPRVRGLGPRWADWNGDGLVPPTAALVARWPASPGRGTNRREAGARRSGRRGPPRRMLGRRPRHRDPRAAPDRGWHGGSAALRRGGSAPGDGVDRAGRGPHRPPRPGGGEWDGARFDVGVIDTVSELGGYVTIGFDRFSYVDPQRGTIDAAGFEEGTGDHVVAHTSPYANVRVLPRTFVLDPDVEILVLDEAGAGRPRLRRPTAVDATGPIRLAHQADLDLLDDPAAAGRIATLTYSPTGQIHPHPLHHRLLRDRNSASSGVTCDTRTHAIPVRRRSIRGRDAGRAARIAAVADAVVEAVAATLPELE